MRESNKRWTWNTVKAARLPAAAWTMIGIIVSSSAFGQQVYIATPRPIFWVILAVIIAAAIVAIARRLPSGALTLPLAIVIAIFGIVMASAVASGLLTPAEVIHVPLFGGLGATLYAIGNPRSAILWFVGISVGDEVFQAILPYRTGSIQDVALNLISATMGYSVARRLFLTERNCSRFRRS